MKQRPKSITVISWILIVMGAISIFPLLLGSMNDPKALELMQQSPLPMSVQYGMIYLGLLVTVGSGIGMLYGKNLARLVYVGWSIIGFVIGIATSPVKVMMIPGFIIFAIVAFFLFRPKANAYFTTTSGATSDAKNI